MKRMMLILAVVATVTLVAGIAWADTAPGATGGDSPIRLARHTSYLGGQYGYSPGPAASYRSYDSGYYTFHDRYRYGHQNSCKPYVHHGYYPRHHVYYAPPAGCCHGGPSGGIPMGF